MDTISSSELLLSNKKGKKPTFKDLVVVEAYEIWCNFLLSEKANTYHFWRYPNMDFEVRTVCSMLHGCNVLKASYFFQFFKDTYVLDSIFAIL